MASCLCQDYLDALVIHVMVDGTCGITTSTDTGDEIVWIVTPHLFLQLALDLLRDNALHTSHKVGIGMRAHRRPNE